LKEILVVNDFSNLKRETEARMGRQRSAAAIRVALLAAAALTASLSLVMAQAGQLDSTFGSGGKVVTNVPGPTNAVATAVTLQSNGKIIVGGTFGGSGNIGLLRYNANGTLDTGFGNSGIALANIPDGILSSTIGVGVQSGGKIVAGGTIYTLSGTNVFIGLGIVRFNPSGSTDTSFGTVGVARALPFDASRCGGSAFALQQDEKILLGGGCVKGSGASQTNFSVLERFNANGSLDSTFGTGGAAVLAEPPAAIALQPDGKIVVAGGGTVSRYNTSGSIDPSFGIFGSMGALGSVAAVVVQGDGKIVVAGTFSDQLTVPADGDFALTRYGSDGTVDETFGSHGGALADFFAGSSSASAFALAIDSRGNLVAAGRALHGSNPYEFAVARFTILGVLDSAFGTGGVVTTSFEQTDSVAALAIQPDGKIVAAGNSLDVNTGNDDFALARYTSQ
jgi:uncharacterized delta-60 repeat protein